MLQPSGLKNHDSMYLIKIISCFFHLDINILILIFSFIYINDNKRFRYFNKYQNFND